MSVKDYVYMAVLYFLKPYSFFENVRKIKKRYVFIHFLLVYAILFLPVFVIVIRTQPHEIYQRVFSLRFEDAPIEVYSQTGFSEELLDAGNTAIYFFEDMVVFSDANMTMYAPAVFFNSESTQLGFGELFNMIAMYNMYIQHLLIPMILLSMVVVMVLTVFFYVVTAFFLGVFRMASSNKFTFTERLKISIMSSLPVAIVCAVAGVLIPIVHLILFQLVNILVLFAMSKRYDLREKEMLALI